ncbi:hypothetical protein K438DRAFT_1431413, partial [Mycena galopus ATCC 62051]
EELDLARSPCRDAQTPQKQLNLEIPHKVKLPGAKLSKMTQALAYKGIKELNIKVSHKATNKNISNVQNALSAQYTHVPTALTIHMEVNLGQGYPTLYKITGDFPLQVHDGAHKIGKYWEH